jgi:hypothetical protein
MTDRIVWKFTPVAQAEDPRWLNREIAQTLFVEAPTSAEAIVAAAAWDSRHVSGHVGNESAHNHSAFADEKLYRVDRTAPEEAAKLDPASGPIWSGSEALVLDNLTN